MNDLDSLWPLVLLAFLIYFVISVIVALIAAIAFWVMLILLVCFVICAVFVIVMVVLRVLVWLQDKPKGWAIKEYFKVWVLGLDTGLTQGVIWWTTLALQILAWVLVAALPLPWVQPITKQEIVTFMGEKGLEFLVSFIILSTIASRLFTRYFLCVPKRKTLSEKFSCSRCGRKSYYPSVNEKTGHLDWTRPGDLSSERGINWLCQNCHQRDNRPYYGPISWE